MSEKKNKKKWPIELKKKIVQEYLSGGKTASEIAEANGFGNDPGRIYKWRHELNQISQGEKIDVLKSEGYSFLQAKKIHELEQEIFEYQKKLAEQVLITDLLKKLHASKNSAPEKNVSGLTETMRLLAPNKKLRKS